MAQSPNRGGFSVPEDSHSKLRELESMITGIGGENPAGTLATVQQQQRALATSATRAVAAKAAAGKDCLAADATAAPIVTRTAQRSISASPSMMKGASMAGKDRPEKRYIGKGFQPPPAESPGPIYQPPVGFAEEALIGNTGFSFGRASRDQGSPIPSMNSSVGGTTFANPSSIGRQVTSNIPTATSAPFSRGPRVNERVFLSRAHERSMHAEDTPGPAAYILDVTKLPMPMAKRAPSAVLMTGKESSKKQFISKAHVVDSMGSATRDADFSTAEASRADSRFYTAPKFSFGTGKRGVGESATDVSVTVGSDPSGTLSPERQRAIAAAKSRTTPGPGHYAPNFDVTIASGPKAVIASAAKTDKIFWNKQLSTRKGEDSPGLRYSPAYTVVEKHVSAATIAGPAGPHQVPDRFTAKQFIGKAFNGGMGEGSPGPIYQAPPVEAGPSYSMSFKEKHYPKTVFPGPSRPRWLSRESAKDNLGSFSPGPKYDTRNDISRQGVSYSFGAAPRSSSALAAPTAGASSQGNDRPPQPHSAEPTEAPVPVHRLPGAKIAPPRTVFPRQSPRDAAYERRQQDAPLIVPRYDATEPRQPQVSFTTAERFGPKGGAVAALGSTGPGPVYTPNFRLIEPRVPGAGFGGLP